jgi:hypothetical protein
MRERGRPWKCPFGKLLIGSRPPLQSAPRTRTRTEDIKNDAPAQLKRCERP